MVNIPLDGLASGSYDDSWAAIKTDGTLWYWGENQYGSAAQNNNMDAVNMLIHPQSKYLVLHGRQFRMIDKVIWLPKLMEPYGDGD